ncbi:MAG: hypothetical protein ACYDH1_18905 [Anaerolineaceae bacterium]
MVSAIQGMGSVMGGGMMPKMKELTSDQTNTISDILSQYDAENVSDDDAKAIFQAFKDAGITPAKGMREAIEAAGFDAEDLRSKGLGDGNMPPPPPQSSSSSTSINLSALQSLQEILSQFDLTNLSDTDQTSLLTKLQESGLINTGSVIDIKS